MNHAHLVMVLKISPLGEDTCKRCSRPFKKYYVTSGTRTHAGNNGQRKSEWIERFTLANPYNEVRHPENYRTPWKIYGTI